MNKQEAIERINDLWSFILEEEPFEVDLINKNQVISIISQIDEPQKVVVPKFIADWIEYCKRCNLDLQMTLSRLDDDREVGNWAYDENDYLINEKVDIFARAWLDGYEIEKEKLYTVEIPNPNNEYSMNALIRLPSSGKIALVALHKPNTSYLKNKEYQLTESEIKEDFDFLWQFAEEVE